MRAVGAVGVCAVQWVGGQCSGCMRVQCSLCSAMGACTVQWVRVQCSGYLCSGYVRSAVGACTVQWVRVAPAVKALDCRSSDPGFKSICCRLKTWAISSSPLCLGLLDETLKAICPFYLMSVPEEVNNLTTV